MSLIPQTSVVLGKNVDGEKGLRTVGSGSLLEGVIFDTIGATYPTTLTEVYAYYQGGLAGTLQATITVTYQDVEKCIILSVVRT